MLCGLDTLPGAVKNGTVFLCFWAIAWQKCAMTSKPHSPALPGDTGARPKVLRRPQHFSRRPGAMEIDLAAAPASASNEPEALSQSPDRRAGTTSISARRDDSHWQEDSRFGMALIFGVVFVNLVLVLLLPLMQRPQAARMPATTLLGGTAAMPSPTAHGGESDITVYSESTDRNRERMDINSLPADYNDFATDPADMPTPTARRMEP